jgi:hypothetical protein
MRNHGNLACVLLVLLCGALPISIAAAAQQVNPRNPVFLTNLVRNADSIRIYGRDTVDPSKWKKQPSHTWKRTSSQQLFADLREAPVDKPITPADKDIKYKFDFLGAGRSLGTALSDGKLLVRSGDSLITLPASWTERLSRLPH